MPFEGININKYLPNADLGRFIARTQMVGDASPEARRGGLAELTMIEDREERERKRKFEEEQKREEIQQKFRQDRFAESIKQYKESSSADERRKLRAGMVLQMMNLGIRDPDEMDLVLNEVEATPLKESEEDKALRENKNKASHELYKNSTPESQKHYLSAIEAGAPEARARLLLEPAPTVKTVGGRLVEVKDGQANVLLGAAPNDPGSKSAMRARALKRFNVVKQSVDEGDPDSLSNMMRMAEASLDLAVAEGRLTPSGAENRRKGYKQVGSALTSFDSAADEALDILNDDKRAAASAAAGDLSRGFLSLSANVQSLASLIPGVSANVDLDEGRWSNQINDLAKDNAVLRSALFSIALSNAVAQGLANGRLTNKAIELAMEDVAANARSPAQIRNKLGEVRRRLATNLRRKLETELGNYSAYDKAEAPLSESGDEATEEVDIYDPDLSVEQLLEIQRREAQR
jgi:hypothetical protein